MKKNAVCVFDRMDENSVFAAAVIKHLTGVMVIEHEQIQYLSPAPEQECYWIGVTPFADMVRRLRGMKHFVVDHNLNNIKSIGSVQYITGTHPSLTTLVITHLIQQLRLTSNALMGAKDKVHPEYERYHQLGCMIATFQDKYAIAELIHESYQAIDMAFQHVYFDEPFTTEFGDGAEKYRDTVRKCKHLLDNSGVEDVKNKKQRLVTTNVINITGVKWYVVKRLLSIAGQVWKTPRVIGESLIYSNNKSQVELQRQQERFHHIA